MPVAGRTRRERRLSRKADRLGACRNAMHPGGFVMQLHVIQTRRPFPISTVLPELREAIQKVRNL